MNYLVKAKSSSMNISGYLDGRGDSNENGITRLTAAIGQGFEDVIQYGVDGICTDYPVRLRNFAG